MEVEHLREFVYTVDEGSFARAAERLNISSPGLSKHIVALEKEVGAPLLARSNVGVQATPLGRMFYQEACDILHVFDNAMRRIASRRDQPPLRLVVDTFVGHRMSDDLLVALEAVGTRGDCYLDLETRDLASDAVYSDGLLGKQADLCLYAHAEDYVPPRGIASERLVDDPLVAVVKNDHHLAGKGSVWMADIGSDIVWMYDAPVVREYYEDLERILRKRGASPHCVMMSWTTNRNQYVNLARQEGGVRLMLRSAAQSLAPLVLTDCSVLAIRDDEANFGLYAHYLENTQNPAVPLAIAELKATAKRVGTAS